MGAALEMQSLKPGWANFYRHFYRADEHPILVLDKREVIVNQTPEFVETVTLKEPAPKVIEVELEPFNMQAKSHALEVLRANHYRRVGRRQPTSVEGVMIFARGWPWLPLRIGNQISSGIWAALRWLFQHRIIGITTHESMVPRLRDIRPRLFGWRKLRTGHG